jgi:hypothetical protein
MYLFNPQDVGPVAGICPDQPPHYPHRLSLLRRAHSRQAVGAEHGLVGLEGRVADPDTDPDPAFFLIADPNSGSGSRVYDLKLKKIYSWKFNFYFLD